MYNIFTKNGSKTRIVIYDKNTVYYYWKSITSSDLCESWRDIEIKWKDAKLRLVWGKETIGEWRREMQWVQFRLQMWTFNKYWYNM